MVLISTKYKFIYIKTLKTAGTSVECYLQRFCYKDDKLPSDVENLVYEVPEKYVNGFISNYGIVGVKSGGSIYLNHPEHKWYHHMPISEVEKQFPYEDYQNYIKICCVRNPWDKIVSVFYHLCKKENQIPDKEGFIRNFNQCLNFVNDQNLYNLDEFHFIRFEHLEEDLLSLTKLLKLPISDKDQLPHIHQYNYKRNYKDFYNNEMREKVEKVFKDLIQKFNYTF